MRLRRALLVEHESDIRDSLRVQLESKGFAVDEVADVERASALLRLKTYDLVVLDMRAMRRRDVRLAIDSIPGPGETQITTRHVRLDPARRRVLVRGRQATLTRHEFDLLFRLMASRGRVFSRAALLEALSQDERYVTQRSVDTLVSRLRRKIERNPRKPELIHTAWGVGYTFVDEGT